MNTPPQLPPLPIDAILPQLKKLLAENSIVILKADTGAGKSTRVPLSLLDESWRAGRRIVMLEPRRLAARSMATWMAAGLGEKPGQRVGWQVRNQYCPGSMIEVVTEGILSRRLQSDPELLDTALIIFDEFHERSLHADLALALCREVQEALRPDLKLLLMSATLESASLCRELNTTALVEAEGRLFPVEVRHLARSPGGSGRSFVEVIAATVQAVQRALDEENGDVLVFLPGASEIRQVEELLQKTVAGERQICITPLYGGLRFVDQQRAIRPDSQQRRRVVLATNIAQTSLTIDGIGCVVDCGLVRRAQFDPATGMTRLITRRIALSSAEQRRGRAGRLRPGICFRLWSRADEKTMKTAEEEEITHSDLSRLALDLAAWGVHKATALRWLTPPPQAAFAQARALLHRLGFVDSGGITARGRRAADLGIDPRLAALLIDGTGSSAPLLAALLGERDLFQHGSGSDLAPRLAALKLFRRDRDQAARRYPLRRKTAEQILASARSLERSCPQHRDAAALSPAALLALAWPERVASRRSTTVPGRVEFLFAGGGSGFLPADDPLAAAEWLVVAAVDGRRSGGRIHLAAEYSRAEIEEQFAGELCWQLRCSSAGKQEKRLVFEEVRRLGRITLDRRRVDTPPPAQLRRALLEAIRRQRLALLPWTEELNHWLARLRWLTAQKGFEQWPDISEDQLVATLEQWLEPFLAGVGSIADLKRINLRHAVHSLLPRHLHKELDREAPARFTTPRGRSLRIDYRTTRGPVVRVKLQEMFGQTDSPRLAGKRVPLIFELLSPADRPLQTTADLASFWENSYHEVAKEMRGRYPKHRWPQDPRTAKAGSSLKRRKQAGG